MGTWNGRGIFAGTRPDNKLRLRKLQHVQQLVRQATIMGFQETHASHAATHNFTHQFASTHWIGWTLIDSEFTFDNIDFFTIDNSLNSCVDGVGAEAHEKSGAPANAGLGSNQSSNAHGFSHLGVTLGLLGYQLVAINRNIMNPAALLPLRAAIVAHTHAPRPNLRRLRSHCLLKQPLKAVVCLRLFLVAALNPMSLTVTSIFSL